MIFFHALYFLLHTHIPQSRILTVSTTNYLLWYYYQQTFPDLILVRRSLCIYCNILCTSKLKWNAPILSLQFDWKLNYCRDFRWIQLIQTVCKKHFHKWKHAQIKIESPTKQLNIKYVYTILISFAIFPQLLLQEIFRRGSWSMNNIVQDQVAV